MLSKVRIGLVALYGLSLLFIALALCITFHSVNSSEHPVMNIFGYVLAPFFYLISTILIYLFVFICNKIEKKPSVFMFKWITKIVGISLILFVVIYSLGSYW